MENRSEERLRMILMNQFANRQKGWEKTQLKIAKSKRSARIRMITSAASIAALIILSLFIFNPLDYKNRDTCLITAEPGKNQAQLIMSDGKTIPLNDSSNISITDASGAEILISEGKSIKYKATNQEKADTALNTIIVPRAGFYSITLSDGTNVWINSESRLSYPVTFSDTKREVALWGEAYFEVAHNPQKPFVVVCNNTTIAVTGTEFNVESYKQGNTITTLVNGGVLLSRGGKTVSLSKGMQGVATDDGITTNHVDVNEYISWKNGYFEFDNTTLAQITARLSRWYDVEFEFDDPNLMALTFSATFPMDENLSFIVQLIEKISSARFTPKEGKIVVNSIN